MVAIANAQYTRTGASLGYTEAWCADFVSDCAKLANQSAAIPFYGGVGDSEWGPGLASRILSAGGRRVTGVPSVGDIAIMDWNGNGGYGHVEIVMAVSGTTVTTIGGNSGRNTSTVSTSEVWKHTYAYNNAVFTCFLRPAYSGSPSPQRKYTITLNANGGTVNGKSSTSIEVTTGYSYYGTIPGLTPSKSNSKFLGWYDSSGNQVYDSNGNGVNGIYWNNLTWIYNGNVTAYARWDTKNKITLNANGGTVNGKSSVVIEVTPGYSYYGTIPGYTPSRSGCTFLGWYDAEGTPVYDEKGTAVDGKYWNGVTWKYNSDIVVYARWGGNYNLTLNANGGTIAGKTTVVLPVQAWYSVISQIHIPRSERKNADYLIQKTKKWR